MMERLNDNMMRYAVRGFRWRSVGISIQELWNK